MESEHFSSVALGSRNVGMSIVVTLNMEIGTFSQ